MTWPNCSKKGLILPTLILLCSSTISSDKNGGAESSYKFCKNIPIKVPLYSDDGNIVTIPCTHNYGDQIAQDNVVLYKESTEKNQVAENLENNWRERILSYNSNSGFRYNITGENELANNYSSVTFKCIFANSDEKNHVIIKLYKDDDLVNVFVKRDDGPCVKFFVNETNIFYCEARKEHYDKKFKWFYQISGADGNKRLQLVENASTTPYDKGNFIGERITLKFPSSQIKAIVCRVQKKDSVNTTENSIPIVMEDGCVETLPKVLDNARPTYYFYTPEIQLTCEYEACNPKKWWFKNGVAMNTGDNHEFTNENGTYVLTLFGIDEPSVRDNYTCFIENDVGTTTRTFLISAQSYWTYQLILYGLLAVLMIIVVSVLAYKSHSSWQIYKWFKIVEREEPILEKSERLVITESGAKLGHGKFGEVKLAKIIKVTTRAKRRQKYFWILRALLSCFKKLETPEQADDDENQNLVKVVKSSIWLPSLKLTQAVRGLQGTLQEIRILQDLHKGRGHEHVVKYLGYCAPSKDFLKVYVVLDYYRFRDLEKYLQEMPRNGVVLQGCVNNLLQWAKQVASALEFISGKNIVHGYVSAKNVLLKLSQGELSAVVCDFGMARFSGSRSNLNIIKDNPYSDFANRPILFRWYPPEAIGTNSQVMPTSKLDSWSFGVLLWEMFTFSTNLPYFVEGVGDRASPGELKRELNNGMRLNWRDALVNIPDDLWNLMNRCWDQNPERRPTFPFIHTDLENISNAYAGGIRHDNPRIPNNVHLRPDNYATHGLMQVGPVVPYFEDLL